MGKNLTPQPRRTCCNSVGPVRRRWLDPATCRTSRTCDPRVRRASRAVRANAREPVGIVCSHRCRRGSNWLRIQCRPIRTVLWIDDLHIFVNQSDVFFGLNWFVAVVLFLFCFVFFLSSLSNSLIILLSITLDCAVSSTQSVWEGRKEQIWINDTRSNLFC